jgi:hypothetical protein
MVNRFSLRNIASEIMTGAPEPKQEKVLLVRRQVIHNRQTLCLRAHKLIDFVSPRESDKIPLGANYILLNLMYLHGSPPKERFFIPLSPTILSTEGRKLETPN